MRKIAANQAPGENAKSCVQLTFHASARVWTCEVAFVGQDTVAMREVVLHFERVVLSLRSILLLVVVRSCSAASVKRYIVV